ncbi:MAG: hypothetical protein EOO52_00540 [Gammaproteobacteria bacterium]|nr:MAG: hypothetical protein EOO52_00540 [Gammaproteobacteria bacterium]
MNASYSVVVKADASEIIVNAVNENIDSKMLPLGFTFDSKLSRYVKFVGNIKEKAKIFEALRDIGILFSDGKEWCPAELFEYFREQGFVNGTFKRISWIKPTEYIIREI